MNDSMEIEKEGRLVLLEVALEEALEHAKELRDQWTGLSSCKYWQDSVWFPIEKARGVVRQLRRRKA